MRTRLMFAFAVAAALAAVPGGLAPRGLNRAAAGELAAAVGGGCYDCMYMTGQCTGTTCTASGTVWQSKVGSGATPAQCFSVATGAPGTDTCTSNTPANCFTFRTCTDAACTNCGAPANSNVNTNCQLTGYLCKG